MTDYPRLNVIYDETVGLQARRFTTPAKYHSHPEGQMQLHRLHRLNADPGYIKLTDEI